MDQFQTIETQSYFQRLKSSLGGVLIGLLFFGGSFVLLWKNEGNFARERAAIKELTAATVEGSAERISPDTVGKPLHIISEIRSVEQLGDTGYLRPGSFLKLTRVAEMFQWVEVEHSETREKMGGGSETVKSWSYEQKWQAGRVDSGSFQRPAGHENPQPKLSRAEFAVAESSFGVWNGGDVLDHLAADEPLSLTTDMLDSGGAGGQLEGDYLYFRRSATSAGSTIGDERLSWQVLLPGTFSVIARHDPGNRLTAWTASNGKEKFLVDAGALGTAELIAREQSAQSLFAWILRGAGFLMMWLGLGLILAPLAMLLAIIPPVASVGRFAIGMITFVVALGLSLATIVIGWVAHNPVVLGVAVVAGLGVAFWWLRRRSAAALPRDPLAAAIQPG